MGETRRNDPRNPRAERPGGSLVFAAGAARRGFSLIELVIVFSIVGVLAAVAVPRFAAGAPTRRLDAAERRILADIDHARELARARSQSVTVAFDAVNDVYAIANARNAVTRAPTQYIVNLTDAPYQVDIGLVNLAGDTVLVHDGFGTPDSGGTIQISSGGRSRIITLPDP